MTLETLEAAAGQPAPSSQGGRSNQPAEIIEAIRLHKAGQLEQSREILHHFLLRDPANVNALLWLAKVTNDLREAIAAAELALALDPENEIAKRAVAAVRTRAQDSAESAPPIDILRVTGMTYAQARALNWPFGTSTGPSESW